MPRQRLALVSSCVVAPLCALGEAQGQSRFERISVSTAGSEANGGIGSGRAAMSADGRHIVWDSYASNLAPYDLNKTVDVFVRDRIAGTTALISTALTGLSANNASFVGGISPDGRFVVFSSSANDLVKFDTNQKTDVFLRDRDPDGNGVFDEGNETTLRVSVDSAGVEGDGNSGGASVSADGTRVAFASESSNLAASDTNGNWDVFIHDVTTGITELVSVSSQGVQGNSGSVDPQLSSDGTILCFASGASNLVSGDKNGRQDLFVRDLVAGTTTRVSVRTDGTESNGDAFDPSMSRDGQRVVFWTHADNLVSGDTNNASDVFVHDRASAATTRLSVSASGSEGDRSSYNPHLSDNGRFVVFSSAATNLAGIETNNSGDVFVLDLATSELRKVSVHLSGEEGAGGSFGYAVSDDGLIVSMIAWDFDLIGGDANGIHDMLARDRTVADPDAAWTTYGAGWPGTLGVPSLEPGADPVMGTTLDVLIGSSTGFYTVGFVLLGLEQISVPTSLGGTLLVNPLVTIPMLLGPAGGVLTGSVPLDDALAGLDVFLQTLELDTGASDGVAFTAGLELTLGQ